VERLQLIRRAQAAGFTLTEIEELFALWDQQQLDDQEIMQRLQAKYAQISDRIAELQQIQHYIADKLAQYQATP
jgi:DNA-binding transcriptional MerR regulator